MLKKLKSSSIASEFISLFFIVIITFAIRIFIMEIYFIPSGSMKLNLIEGDYIFSTKSYGYSKYSFPYNLNFFDGKILAKSPVRGDIIIMKPPKNNDERWVKRLIGMPGDKIQIIDNILYINDIPVKRELIGDFKDENNKQYLKYNETLPNGISYYSYILKNDKNSFDSKSNSLVYHIPQNHYFFLGDNRDESNDSRYDLGYVPEINLIAKARFVIFSIKETLIWKTLDMVHGNLWSWLRSFRLNRIFVNI